MTDRELLELAAKAGGVDWSAFHEKGHWGLQLLWHGRDSIWNPLTDDGDALRLAVKLGITISFEHWSAPISEPAPTVAVDAFAGWFPSEREELTGTDPYAATRRAIVRAAAEIGKAMP